MDEKLKDEVLKHHPIIVGNNVSDCEAPNMKSLEKQEIHDAFWKERFNATAGEAIEIQYEGPLHLGLWRNFPDMIGQRPLIGVHQPLKGRNLIGLKEIADRSMADTLASMDMAQHIRARYFAYHLTSVDDWVTPREEQLRRALSALATMYKHYVVNGHGYMMALEVPLEYPKHPASEEEIFRTIALVRNLNPDTVLIVDIAHHWHNQKLVPSDNFALDYKKRLTNLLLEIETIYPKAIIGFHLGGSFIDTTTDKHETHGIPGHIPNHPLNVLSDFEFGRPADFTGEWMQIDDVLHALAKWSKQVRREVGLILEVNDINDSQRNLARTVIEERLKVIHDYV